MRDPRLRLRACDFRMDVCVSVCDRSQGVGLPRRPADSPLRAGLARFPLITASLAH